VREREDGEGCEMAGGVQRAAIGSDEPVGAGRRRKGGGEHGAVVSAVAAAARRELRLFAAGKERR